MTEEEMKNKISMELQNPITQQGFEIICKQLAEKDRQIEELKATYRKQRNKRIDELQKMIHALETQIEKRDADISFLKELAERQEAQIEKEEDFLKTMQETESRYGESKAEEDYLFKILSTVPDDLKKGESRTLKCPICGKDSLNVSRSSYNGHLAVSCKCGVMIMQ